MQHILSEILPAPGALKLVSLCQNERNDGYDSYVPEPRYLPWVGCQACYRIWVNFRRDQIKVLRKEFFELDWEEAEYEDNLFHKRIREAADRLNGNHEG